MPKLVGSTYPFSLRPRQVAERLQLNPRTERWLAQHPVPPAVHAALHRQLLVRAALTPPATDP